MFPTSLDEPSAYSIDYYCYRLVKFPTLIHSHLNPTPRYPAPIPLFGSTYVYHQFAIQSTKRNGKPFELSSFGDPFAGFENPAYLALRMSPPPDPESSSKPNNS
ncbi:hypothetical protein CC2G_014985 [Coprinopsis cinerea AmutBmut pab1-1]|nr:hypothetical protein CC2G_014985 [Coprinopsis cinerea AmutBmut pab1-1]